jgi:DNA-binding NarL/FixJ family response regulator
MTAAELPSTSGPTSVAASGNPGAAARARWKYAARASSTPWSLFERYWEAGTPFGEAPLKDEYDLSPQERELLLLLGIGCTDGIAARRLGVSVRTVRRMNSELLSRLGARSRFEAGVRAVKKGWL